MFRRENTMILKQFVKPAGAIAIFAAIVLAGMLSSSPRTRATADDNDSNESKIQRGFEIAPVPLNLDGKDRELVGLGSYIVNAQADCDGCHSAGPPTEFARGGNPYFGQPEKINPATYLGGGRDFGPFPSPNSPNLKHLFSRNLTPNKTGMPEGGRTFAEFRQIIRTGVDLDLPLVHPNCSAGQIDCLPFPFRGDLLQVMPWPIYMNMTEHDLRAIYEYLSAIPCIDTIVPGQPQLRNDCQ
jgi:hypothetical protein